MSAETGRSRQHTADDWNRVKRRFCDLYKAQNMPLPEVRQVLLDEDGFDATYVQCASSIKFVY